MTQEPQPGDEEIQDADEAPDPSNDLVRDVYDDSRNLEKPDKENDDVQADLTGVREIVAGLRKATRLGAAVDALQGRAQTAQADVDDLRRAPESATRWTSDRGRRGRHGHRRARRRRHHADRARHAGRRGVSAGSLLSVAVLSVLVLASGTRASADRRTRRSTTARRTRRGRRSDRSCRSASPAPRSDAVGDRGDGPPRAFQLRGGRRAARRHGAAVGQEGVAHHPVGHDRRRLRRARPGDRRQRPRARRRAQKRGAGRQASAAHPRSLAERQVQLVRRCRSRRLRCGHARG